ncbi:MAG: nodulation protein NfeD, partial [Elusimicrobiota bacterium]
MNTKIFAIALVALTLNTAYAKDNLNLKGTARPVVVLEAKSPINPVLSKYLTTGIKKAHEREAQAVVIILNTPGGLMTAMRDIIEAILNTPIPVIVYV